jgi:sugar phosphate isomerase/epimerase
MLLTRRARPAPATLDLWLGGILTTATPGQGHTDFPAILDALRAIGYDDWVAVEILPHPSADEAAAQAITYLRTLVPAAVA